jgi:hypothetical protein
MIQSRATENQWSSGFDVGTELKNHHYEEIRMLRNTPEVMERFWTRGVSKRKVSKSKSLTMYLSAS